MRLVLSAQRNLDLLGRGGLVNINLGQQQGTPGHLRLARQLLFRGFSRKVHLGYPDTACQTGFPGCQTFNQGKISEAALTNKRVMFIFKYA